MCGMTPGEAEKSEQPHGDGYTGWCHRSSIASASTRLDPDQHGEKVPEGVVGCYPDPRLDAGAQLRRSIRAASASRSSGICKRASQMAGLPARSAKVRYQAASSRSLPCALRLSSAWLSGALDSLPLTLVGLSLKSGTASLNVHLRDCQIFRDPANRLCPLRRYICL